MRVCTIQECNNKYHCSGLCKLHYSRKWDRDNKEKISELKKKALSVMRTRVIGYYSDFRFRCACCGCTGMEFLTIDHIKGKKSIGHKQNMKGKLLYRWLINNNYPDGFQVLCWNCNSAKGIYGKCPHN